MLSLLHIENIAVIEQADIEFEDGLTVLTGETGAGKSIIIDSVGAILGKRTSRDLVRAGAEKGFVSAIFTDLPQELTSKLQEYGLDGEEPDSLHIQRQLFRRRQNRVPNQHEAGGALPASGAVPLSHQYPWAA